MGTFYSQRDPIRKAEKQWLLYYIQLEQLMSRALKMSFHTGVPNTTVLLGFITYTNFHYVGGEQADDTRLKKKERRMNRDDTQMWHFHSDSYEGI